MPVANQFNEPQYGWPTFALAAGVAVVLSQLGALLPAWRATQVSPAEALRYE
jgi:ABC-type lipoprotein release transport system permease subunit